MLKKYILLALGLVFSCAPAAFAAQEEEHEIFGTFYSEPTLDMNRISIIKKILQSDPLVVKARDKERNATPLHMAAHMNLTEVSQLLIQYDADVNAVDQHQLTPLHYGAVYENMVSLLVQAGAHINAKGSQGITPLHIACVHEAGGPPSVYEADASVRLLLQFGADTELVTYGGQTTPLHFAAVTNKEKTMRLLLRAGACVDQEDGAGNHTPFHATLIHHLPATAAGRCLGTKYTALGILLEFGIPLTEAKEIAELEKDAKLYEAVRQLVEKVRKFWRDHIPALEDHYLGSDYGCLQLPDALRALLLDFIATPALPAKHFS